METQPHEASRAVRLPWTPSRLGTIASLPAKPELSSPLMCGAETAERGVGAPAQPDPATQGPDGLREGAARLGAHDGRAVRAIARCGAQATRSHLSPLHWRAERCSVTPRGKDTRRKERASKKEGGRGTAAPGGPRSLRLSRQQA